MHESRPTTTDTIGERMRGRLIRVHGFDARVDERVLGIDRSIACWTPTSRQSVSFLRDMHQTARVLQRGLSSLSIPAYHSIQRLHPFPLVEWERDVRRLETHWNLDPSHHTHRCGSYAWYLQTLSYRDPCMFLVHMYTFLYFWIRQGSNISSRFFREETEPILPHGWKHPSNDVWAMVEMIVDESGREWSSQDLVRIEPEIDRACGSLERVSIRLREDGIALPLQHSPKAVVPSNGVEDVFV